MNKTVFLKNNIAVGYSIDIEQMIRPFEKIGVDLFCYHRKYRDNTELILTNNALYAAQAYTGRYIVDSAVVDEMGLNEFEHVVFPTNISDNMPISLVNLICDAKNIFNAINGVTLKLNSADYFEIFGFTTKINTVYGLNQLLNNMDTFKRFILDFTKVASDIINQCESNNIRLISLDAFNLNQKRAQKCMGLNSNNRALHNPALSQRELDCAKHLLMGKNMRETASELLISPRTVETHIENIKNKLGCNKKSEVISKLLEIDSVRFAVGYDDF